jgi:CheY-like chemotaxis protein
MNDRDRRPQPTTEFRGLREGSPKMPRRRVLVVEDHRDMADSLCQLLESWGHEVTVAYSGTTGIRKAIQLRPEVVLCDLGLPGQDGYGVARMLRRDPDTRAARLIAISAYGMDEYRQRSLAAGFDLFMPKPIDLEQLRQLLAAAPSHGPSS